MAHALKRLEGFEMGTFISLLGDENTLATISSAAADRYSGDYGCVITNDGVSAARIRIANVFDGDGATSTTNLSVAVSYRVAFKVRAYPSINGLTVMQLEGSGGATRARFAMSTTGVLTLNAVAGSTPLALETWYILKILADSSGSGVTSVRIYNAGETSFVQEFTNVAPGGVGSNGSYLRLMIGQTLASGSHTIVVDDVAVETAGSVASIDYPAKGRVVAVDVNGDGTYDGVWGATTSPNAWLSCIRPHDGDTTTIAISGVGGTIRIQTFTIETPEEAGISGTINGVQFCQATKKDTGSTVDVRIFARRGVTDMILTSTEIPSGTTYNFNASMHPTNPFTSSPWDYPDFTSFQIGSRGITNLGTAVLRVSTVFLYVDADIPETPSGGGGSDIPGGGSEPIPAAVVLDRFCASVIFDPGGPQEIDLSTRLTVARPLRQERDALLRDYRASDVDLEFSDTDGIFIETNPLSFLINPLTNQPEWLGKTVRVALQLGAEILTRYIGQVIAVQAERGLGRLKIADRMQAMFDRPLLANTVGRIVSTTGAVGLGPSINVLATNAPVSGWYLGNLTLLNQAAATRNKAPRCQTWTLTFTSEAIPDGTTHPAFFITGSVTGFDGEGQHGVPGSYVSQSGQIAINTDRVTGDIRESYLGVGPGNAPKGSTTSIRTVWKPTAGTTAVQAMREFLLDFRGVGLTADQIDPSIAALAGTVADQLLPGAEFIPTIARMSFDERYNVLAAVQSLALHLGCSFIEKANGNIGVASFMPRVLEEVPLLCGSDDLMELAIDHLPIYNQYTVEHAFSESNDKFTQGFASPDPDDNDSFLRYDRILPAPSTLQFPGYDASNAPWMDAIALALYDRYKDPRRIYSIKAKAERLSADMGDVFRIDSFVPTITSRFSEPISIDRQITGALTVDMDLIEVDSEIVSGECGGYLGLDNDETGLDDDCWGVF